MPPETHFFSDFAWDLIRRHEFPLVDPDLRDELARFASLKNSKGLDIDPDRLSEELGGVSESVFGLFETIVGALGGSGEILGEKTPGHLWWWEPLSLAAPTIRFVVTVRDPRAVVASTLSLAWHDDMDPDAWGDRLHLALAARWAFDQELAARLVDRLGPSRSLVLRYEDVVADPQRFRSAIARLLGLSDSDGFQDAPESLVQPWEHWKMRALGEVTTDRVETWRDELGERRAAEVAWICRSGMIRFGYPVSHSPVADLRHSFANRRSHAQLAKQLDDYRLFVSRIAEIEL
jgi:hypothetical protein